jgi:serine protease inhibitor
VQQSVLEVNESGSIGASATYLSVVALSIQPDIEDRDMIVDRPFIVMIVDRKYAVPYFIAKVSDPR